MLELIQDHNPWWSDPAWRCSGIERNILKYMTANRDDVSVIVVKGPVCSGKTSLLMQFIGYLLDQEVEARSILYFPLDHAAVKKLMGRGYDFFQEIENYTKSFSGKVYLIFDEIQKILDSDVISMLASHVKLKLILSSSFDTPMMKNLNREFMGRTTTFYLFPFSFREYLFTQSREPEVLQKLLNLEALMRFLIIDPETTFMQLKEFSMNNPAIFQFIQSHFEEYALYGGYPQIIFRNSDQDVFDCMFSIIKTCIGSLVDHERSIPTDVRDYVQILERIAGGQLDEPNYDAGQLQTILTNAYLIFPARAFNPDREMRALMPVRFILTDHGMRNIFAGFQGLSRVMEQKQELLANLMASQMTKFLYFDEIRSKELYYMADSKRSFYRYIFCDALDNVYPIGFVSDEEIKADTDRAYSIFETGILFTTGEFRIIENNKNKVFLLPYTFLAGI